MSTWLRKGGDNFQMFEKKRIKLYPGEDAVNLVMEYIKKTQPIAVGLDERIIIGDSRMSDHLILGKVRYD